MNNLKNERNIAISKLFKKTWNRSCTRIFKYKKKLTGISLMGNTILGTCLADRDCRIHIFMELTKSSVNSDPGATLRNRTTLSSEPSFFTCDTHTLSWISLKVSTGKQMIHLARKYVDGSLRPGMTQIGMLICRDQLESWNFGFSKYRHYMI